MTEITDMKSRRNYSMDRCIAGCEKRTEKIADQPIQQDLKEQRLAVPQTSDPAVNDREQ